MITGVIRNNSGSSVSFPQSMGDVVTQAVTEEDIYRLPAFYTINSNGLPITFSIVGGDDRDLFRFTSNGLQWAQTPDADTPADTDHDNVYEVLIQVETEEGFDQLPVYITVVDDDSALRFTSSDTVTVRNRVSSSTSIYQGVLAEPEEITQISYSIISGEDQNLFHIDPDTGYLTFDTPPDYFSPKDVKADNYYKITVEASYYTSAQELYHSSQDVTIIVEPPHPGNDFSGDWSSDILLQDAATGSCFVWQLGGRSTLSSSGSVGWTPPDAGWRAAATGDFNGDGISDILLQNAINGDCFIWQQDGHLGTPQYGYVGWRPPTADWEVKATGDFDGNGISDILLQNSQTTQCYIWELGGTWGEDGRMDLVDWGAVGWTPPKDEQNDWRVKGTGDYNRDGYSGILFQNAVNGQCYIWEQDGTTDNGVFTKLYASTVGWIPPTADWHAVA